MGSGAGIVTGLVRPFPPSRLGAGVLRVRLRRPPTPTLPLRGGGGRWACWGRFGCLGGVKALQQRASDPLHATNTARPLSPRGRGWVRGTPRHSGPSFGARPVRALRFDHCLQIVRRRGGLRGIGAEHLQRRGVAGRKKPFAAAISMAPAFKMHALRVFAREHVVFEFIIRRARAGPFQMRLISGGEFGFVGADTAIGAGQSQHGRAPA